MSIAGGGGCLYTVREGRLQAEIPMNSSSPDLRPITPTPDNGSGAAETDSACSLPRRGPGAAELLAAGEDGSVAFEYALVVAAVAIPLLTVVFFLLGVVEDMYSAQMLLI